MNDLGVEGHSFNVKYNKLSIENTIPLVIATNSTKEMIEEELKSLYLDVEYCPSITAFVSRITFYYH